MIKKALIFSAVFALTMLNAYAGETKNAQENKKANETPVQAQASHSNITINNVTNPCPEGNCGQPMTLSKNNTVIVSVVGQGVAPSSTISPAQASALAKRAAIADAYRQMAEKINGVRIEGRDYIRNMVAKRSEVRTCVSALIKNANVVESRFNDGLFEVEMEVRVAGSQWYDRFAQ